MRQAIGKHASILLLLFLSACATDSGVSLPELSDWEVRQAVLAELDQWEFRGRIGVNSGSEGFNGKLRFWQDVADFRATLSGPLGVGTVRIEGDENRLRLTDKDGVVTELEDAEAELKNRYGWTVPVTSLRFWALGIPDPASPAETEFGADGRLIHLQQRSWSVDISEYREGGGQLMPRRILAVNDDANVRLIIDQWTFR